MNIKVTTFTVSEKSINTIPLTNCSDKNPSCQISVSHKRQNNEIVHCVHRFVLFQNAKHTFLSLFVLMFYV